MSPANAFGKVFILIGVIFVVVGMLMIFGPKIPLSGKLPGDISIQRKNFSLYFPITTCILISIILTLIMWLLGKR